MKKIVLVVAALLFGERCAAADPAKVDVGANAGVCAMDSEIAQQDRSAIEGAALAFVNNMLGTQTDLAYAAMTKEVQARTPLEQFHASVPVLQTMGPFQNVHLAHTYLVHSIGSGPDARAICGTLADYKWVSVAIKPGQTQAHVEIAAATRNNDWDFTLWLLPESGVWKIQYFNMGVSSIVGQTPEMLIAKARQELQSGRAFNAAMLYTAAQATLQRGPAFQLGLTQELQEDLSKFSLPEELKGTPPFMWRMAGKTYRVAEVSVIGIDKQLGLVFTLPTAEWKGEQDADKSNRAFIEAFRATHSDYSQTFSFLTASAMKPDNSGGFRTVYDNSRGFL